MISIQVAREFRGLKVAEINRAVETQEEMRASDLFYLIKDTLLQREIGVKINAIFNTQERSWMERAPSLSRSRLQRCSGLTPSAYEDTHLV